MTAVIVKGPWPAGSAGTVTLFSAADFGEFQDITSHVHKGRVYFTVVKA